MTLRPLRLCKRKGRKEKRFPPRDSASSAVKSKRKKRKEPKDKNSLRATPRPLRLKQKDLVGLPNDDAPALDASNWLVVLVFTRSPAGHRFDGLFGRALTSLCPTFLAFVVIVAMNIHLADFPICLYGEVEGNFLVPKVLL